MKAEVKDYLIVCDGDNPKRPKKLREAYLWRVLRGNALKPNRAALRPEDT